MKTGTPLYAAGYGALIWLGICLIGNDHEAWDTGLYWMAGFPALVVGAAALGWMMPEKSWRWGAWMSGGQFIMSMITGLIGGGSFSLFPLFLIAAFMILALPLVLTSWLTGVARRKFRPIS